MLLVVGAAAQQVGWWSLYGTLALWCGLDGLVSMVVWALGFDCGVAHSGDWNCTSQPYTGRPYTPEERREENKRRRAAGLGELPDGARKRGLRGLFWASLAVYLSWGGLATILLAAFCPSTGTDEDWGERAGHHKCGNSALFAFFSLLPVCVLLHAVGSELVAMGRGP